MHSTLGILTTFPIQLRSTWNRFGCSVTGQILMDTAAAMNASGLFKAGYEYVNSDVRTAKPARCRAATNSSPPSPPRLPPPTRRPNRVNPNLAQDCWMNAARDANGNQVANPAKFPQGFKAVADYIHSLGLKSGLYTAKGSRTCAGFAASCQHEVQDAAQWASWGIARTRQPPPNHAGATLRPR